MAESGAMTVSFVSDTPSRWWPRPVKKLMPCGPKEVADCIDAQDDGLPVSLANAGRCLRVKREMEPASAASIETRLEDRVKILCGGSVIQHVRRHDRRKAEIDLDRVPQCGRGWSCRGVGGNLGAA